MLLSMKVILKQFNCFFEHANKNNIILTINEKVKYGRFPFLEVVNNNNIEIIKTLY